MFVFFLTVPVDTGSQYVLGVRVCGVFALNISTWVGIPYLPLSPSLALSLQRISSFWTTWMATPWAA